MTCVLIAGNERLTEGQIEALTASFEKLGASVGLFPTNGGGARFNWGEFKESLRGKTHFILFVGKRANCTTLIEDTYMWDRKVAIVYLDGPTLEFHSQLLGARSKVDLIVVSSQLDHPKVPNSFSNSMVAEDLISSADDIAKNFLGTAAMK